MQGFSDFIEQGGVSGLPNVGADIMAPWETSQKQKPWKAKKADVLEFWRRLRPGLPLHIKPIDPHHRGTRFHEDGLRVTGSPEFINSILSRIKDFLQYDDNDATGLDVEYRQIETKEGDLYNKPVFVAYVHVMKKMSEKPKDVFKPKPLEKLKPPKLEI